MPLMLALERADRGIVKRLRGPLPAAHVFLIALGGAAYGGVLIAAGPAGPLELFALLIALEFAVQPVSTLIHELGHAAAARRATGKPVSIIVGRGPWLTFSIDQVRVNFSVLPTRGVMIRGVCRYDAREVSWRRRGLIALAGPAATLIQLLISSLFTFELWPDAGAVVRAALLLSLIGLGIGLVGNLVPKRRGPGASVVSDGWQALVAFRFARQGAPLTAPAEASPPGRGTPSGEPIPAPSAGSPGSPTATDRPPSKATADEGARIGTSVPPPGASSTSTAPAHVGIRRRKRSRVLDICAGCLLSLAVLSVIAIAEDHTQPGYFAAHWIAVIVALTVMLGISGLALYLSPRISN